MREAFITKTFRPATEAVIGAANTIISEYQAQGFLLTLRQLYYQFVARALIPNTERDYKRLGNIVNDARLAGLMDWQAIEDRTRNLVSEAHWSSPAAIIEAARDSYAIDKWQGQDTRPEVWIEKEALVGVIEGVCQANDVSYFACRGYVSQSEQYAAAQRHAAYGLNGQRVVVLHLGDHDPSGIDMTRDNRDRLEMFDPVFGAEVRRLALNFDQVEEHGPPPNPAKMTDSRFVDYAARYGTESWELDALEPATIASLVESAIAEYRDANLWDEAVAREDEGRAALARVADALAGDGEE